MLIRGLLDATSLFTPRSMCFAEADASTATATGGSGGVPTATDPEPDIDIDVGTEDNGDEPDDLEEVEFEGRRHKIPKGWKDPLEQGKDYRFKTGKVAEERRAAEADRARYKELNDRLITTLKATEPAQPDEAMLDRTSDKYDPDAYHLAAAKWRRWAQQAYEADQERKRLQSEDNAKADRERGERKSKTETELLRAFPQWKDPAVKAAERAKMEAYARENGVSDDEFGELDTDHRLTKMVYKSMLYDQAVAKALAKRGEPQTETVIAQPVRKTSGGGGGRNSNDPPKDTESYIKWRKKGGKM